MRPNVSLWVLIGFYAFLIVIMSSWGLVGLYVSLSVLMRPYCSVGVFIGLDAWLWILMGPYVFVLYGAPFGKKLFVL